MSRGELRVYGTDCLPPNLKLRRPILTAAISMELAAKILRVSVYHLSTHPLSVVLEADRQRALATPGEIVLAGDERPRSS